MNEQDRFNDVKPALSPLAGLYVVSAEKPVVAYWGKERELWVADSEGSSHRLATVVVEGGKLKARGWVVRARLEVPGEPEADFRVWPNVDPIPVVCLVKPLEVPYRPWFGPADLADSGNKSTEMWQQACPEAVIPRVHYWSKDSDGNLVLVSVMPWIPGLRSAIEVPGERLKLVAGQISRVYLAAAGMFEAGYWPDLGCQHQKMITQNLQVVGPWLNSEGRGLLQQMMAIDRQAGGSRPSLAWGGVEDYLDPSQQAEWQLACELYGIERGALMSETDPVVRQLLLRGLVGHVYVDPDWMLNRQDRGRNIFRVLASAGLRFDRIFARWGATPMAHIHRRLHGPENESNVLHFLADWERATRLAVMWAEKAGHQELTMRANQAREEFCRHPFAPHLGRLGLM